MRHRLQLPSEPKSNASNANTASTADDTAASAAVAAPTSGSARSSASAEEPSLLFYSLYMHLLNWKSYQQDSTLKRPAHWGEETYLVGERASDSLGNHPGNSHIPKNGIGMNLRDAQNRYIGFAPRGTKLILGERRGRSGYYAVTRIIGTVVPEGITGAYVFKGELTPAGTEPAAKGTVVILDPPIEINAGDVVGYLGQYQRYIDMDPLGASSKQRPLVQVDVFTAQDIRDFIGKSRERAAKLPDNQKTLLHIDEGAKLVLPAKPDLQLVAGEGVAMAPDSPKSGPWVKVRKGALQIAASRLPGYKSQTRTYGNGATLSMVLGETDTGSPPLSRTLTRRPIEALRSVHVEAKEVQYGVQARCG